MNDQRKLEIINEALLKHVDHLEQSVSYWKAETDKGYEVAHRWRDQEIAKADDVREKMDALCAQIEALGAIIPSDAGGSMEREPCNLIIAAAATRLARP